MAAIHTMSCEKILATTLLWCERYDEQTTESFIGRVAECQAQGEVFLCWVRAHVALIRIETEHPSLLPTFRELEKLAKERSPSFSNDIDRFSQWCRRENSHDA